MKKSNVLVTASGGIVAQGIMKCLKNSNERKKSNTIYKIFATDTNAKAPGLYRADVGILIPPVTAANYLKSIIKICIEKKIKAIFIGSDEELLPLTKAKEEIENKTGAIVISNPLEVVLNASDKWKTYEFLKEHNLPRADSSLLQDQVKFIKEYEFPIVVKPREGHGSLHFYVVHNTKELENATNAIRNAGWRPLLQEYLSGDDSEFTTGITVGQDGKIMSSISMKKTLKGGQTYKAFINDFRDVRKSAEQVAIKIGARGAINIQSKMIKGKPKIFEINARFSATLPLRAVAGINEPDIVFRNMVLGENIKMKNYKKLVCMRYWNEVYVPLSTYRKVEQDGKIEKAYSLIPNYF
ncbi:MAG TPA: ATP-grasp domain-containing protein [Candidatus Nitrosotalea sp.]|nr:ATP-grasp domain-containing protein [Candidatus Nitrosotalea sp.]